MKAKKNPLDKIYEMDAQDLLYQLKDVYNLDELYKLEKLQTPEEVYHLTEPYDPKKAYTPYIKSIEHLSDDEIINHKLRILLFILHNINILWGKKNEIESDALNDSYSLFNDESIPKSIRKMCAFSNSSKDDQQKLTDFEKLGGTFPKILTAGNPNGNLKYKETIRRIFQMLFAAEYTKIKDTKKTPLAHKLITTQLLNNFQTYKDTRITPSDVAIYLDYPISIIGNLLFQIRQRWYQPVTYNNNLYPSVYRIDFLSDEIYNLSKKYRFEDSKTLSKEGRKVQDEFHTVIKNPSDNQKKNYIEDIQKIYDQHYEDIKLLYIYMLYIYGYITKLSQHADISEYSNLTQQTDFPEIFHFISLDLSYMSIIEPRAQKNFPLNFTSCVYNHPFLAPIHGNKNLEQKIFPEPPKPFTLSDNLFDKIKGLAFRYNSLTSKEMNELQELLKDFEEYKKKLSYTATLFSVTKYQDYLNKHCSKCPYITKADKEKGRLMRCSLPFGCLSCEHHLGILDELKHVYKVLHP